MKYYNLSILFMIALKCAADEKPTTVDYTIAVDNVTNSDVFNNANTEAVSEKLVDVLIPIPNINNLSEPLGIQNTFINATDVNAVGPFKKNEFRGLRRRLPQQRFRTMINILGSLVKGLAKLNETDSNEGAKDDEDTIENVTNHEFCNESVSPTEAPEELNDKWIKLSNMNNSSESQEIESILINVTNAYAVDPLVKKDFSKKAIPGRLP